MGSVYRRGYKDRNTGVVKRTRTYTIKFRGTGRSMGHRVDQHDLQGYCPAACLPSAR